MKVRFDDTVAAIATAAGESALSIVRLSGPAALGVADRVFTGKRPLATSRGFTVHHGTVSAADGRSLDEVLATVFRAPRSYTGEDMVEFSCHGGLQVPASVLEAVLEAGARQADPGEFTRRAFINGRIDLTRAEAVADLIASQSRSAQAISMRQLEGRLSERITALRTALVTASAALELELDFSEEGIDLVDRRELAVKLKQIREEIADLAGSYAAGRVVREGVTAVLAGRPNAGKSSLFNALLRENRAIVTPLPGTTRDTLEENAVISGILFHLIDTAGLREGGDAAEEEGVVRTHRAVGTADMVIYIIDLATESIPAASSEAPAVAEGQKLIIVGNKVDLTGKGNARRFMTRLGQTECPVVSLSALTGEGVQLLVAAMADSVLDGMGALETGGAVANLRHRNVLLEAAGCLGRAETALSGGEPNELVAYDVRDAVGKLSLITGEVTTDEILNSIFARFCIGK